MVPTSWEVFPNALSAALQYLSLDWPTENGWVNYNSLQVLAYFTTIFLAAPLAAATGFRMSGAWPSKAEKLSRAYPIEVARAIHLPVMFYFVAFIVVHVALVFSTGALRNLNHAAGHRRRLVRRPADPAGPAGLAVRQGRTLADALGRTAPRLSAMGRSFAVADGMASR